MAHLIVDELVEKKGENIVLLDVSGISSFTDFFILCSCTSNRMLRSLAAYVTDKIKTDAKITNRFEGNSESGWIILDYGSIVVHLMDEKLRNYYRIEDLWRDGKILIRMQ